MRHAMDRISKDSWLNRDGTELEGPEPCVLDWIGRVTGGCGWTTMRYGKERYGTY
jgi:hypothetical protein